MTVLTTNVLSLRNQRRAKVQQAFPLAPPPPPPAVVPLVDGTEPAVPFNVTFSGNAVHPVRDVAAYPGTPDRVTTPEQLPVAAIRFVDHRGLPVNASAGLPSSAFVGNVAPGSPQNGMLWWNTDRGEMFVWYNDGNSSQWVPATPTVGEKTTPYDFGAKGDGIADDYLAFKAFGEATVPATKFIPRGTYNLGTQWVPPQQMMDLHTAPDAVFTGAASPSWTDTRAIVDYMVTPGWTNNLFYKEFDSSFDPYSNIFANAFLATNTGAQAPTVALFAQAKAMSAGPGAPVWGANIVAVTDRANTYLYGLEINVVQGVNSGFTYGTAYGLYIASSGFAAPTVAINVQANTAQSPWQYGLVFGSRPGMTSVTGTLILASLNGLPVQTGLDFSQVTFTGNEIVTKNLLVAGGASVNYLRVTGGLAGSAVTVKADGTDAGIGLNLDTKGIGGITYMTNGVVQFITGGGTGPDNMVVTSNTGLGVITARGTSANVGLMLRGKGTSGGTLQDGAAVTKFSYNTTGIGFFATAPTALSTGWASQTAAASKADLGATPTVGALASWASAVTAELKAKGLFGP